MTDPRELAQRALNCERQWSEAVGRGPYNDAADLARELLSALDALDAARKEMGRDHNKLNEQARELGDVKAERDRLYQQTASERHWWPSVTKEEAMWFVYDPTPVDRDGPVLWGEFDTEAEAWEYANEQHPDDEGGDTKVLESVKPT